MHDGTTDLDVNHFSQAGMEMDCPHSVVSNNISHHNGGEGYRNFADYSVWSNNKAYDNGKLTKAACVAGAGADCEGVQSGFFFLSSSMLLSIQN